MASMASLLGLLLVALVLAEDGVNITFYEPNFSYEGNLTALVAGDRFNLTLKHLVFNDVMTVTTRTTVTTAVASTPKPRTSAVTFRPPIRFPVMPHYHHGPRWGPYFEDGTEPQNVTARVGTTVRLDCKIGMLQDKMVTWLHRKQDSIHLLTVGRQAYSSDQRITLSFRYPNNWRLEILFVTRRDAGLYECQISTHPPRVKSVYLSVTAPEVVIIDEKNNKISERYYKAGSSVDLTCMASHVEAPNDVVTWRWKNVVIKDGVSFNQSLGEAIVIAFLKIPHAEKSHSGNYTCGVGELASTMVAVHILNGELPAAVHGNSDHLARNREFAFLFGFCISMHALATR